MNIPDNAMKRGEKIFDCECGYTDTRHKINLTDKRVPEAILREIENGCTIETLERIAADFPICKYRTQITIHGVFPSLKTNYIGSYKNLVQNKNKSIGVKWTAIDHMKRAEIFRLAKICDDWGICENSQAFFIQRVKTAHDNAETAAFVAELQGIAQRIERARDLFSGGIELFKVPYWGRTYIILRVSVNSFYQRDFDALACVLCNRASMDAIRAAVAEHEENERKREAAWERENAERAAKWQAERAAENARREAFRQSLALPFAAEYGEHKAKQGDLYAVVVHTNPYDRASDFCVKYRVVKKAFGRLCAYECDENGMPTGKRGREIVNGRYKGYRKIAA